VAEALHVGAWVRIRADVPDYGGQVGPIEWIDQNRAEDDYNPYGIDLIEPADSLFFAADELIVLASQPENDTRLTRLVVLDGTDYLLVATSRAQLDEQEQEFRETNLALVGLISRQGDLLDGQTVS